MWVVQGRNPLGRDDTLNESRNIVWLVHQTLRSGCSLLLLLWLVRCRSWPAGFVLLLIQFQTLFRNILQGFKMIARDLRIFDWFLRWKEWLIEINRCNTRWIHAFSYRNQDFLVLIKPWFDHLMNIDKRCPLKVV